MRQHIPNFVTGVRILLTPVIAFVIWQPQSAFLAALGLFLFIIASASDWLDGYLARQMNIVSPVGRMLDPIADKLLIACALLALAHVTAAGWLCMVPATIILIREFIISGLREFLAKRSFSAPVTILAKWKTTAQILALGFLIGAPGFPNFPFAHEIGLTLLWIAAGMTVQTGYGYVRGAIRHVA